MVGANRLVQIDMVVYFIPIILGFLILKCNQKHVFVINVGTKIQIQIQEFPSC
jgi:hypothetical protein